MTFTFRPRPDWRTRAWFSIATIVMLGAIALLPVALHVTSTSVPAAASYVPSLPPGGCVDPDGCATPPPDVAPTPTPTPVPRDGLATTGSSLNVTAAILAAGAGLSAIGFVLLVAVRHRGDAS